MKGWRYFVGGTDILVHNMQNGVCEVATQAAGKATGKIGGFR